MLRDRESAVLRGALQLLALRGFHAVRINSGLIIARGGYPVRLAPAGTSDILGTVPGSGRTIAIETKRGKGGRLSPAQDAFLATITRLGGVSLLIHDLADLDLALGALVADPWATLGRSGEVLPGRASSTTSTSPEAWP